MQFSPRSAGYRICVSFFAERVVQALNSCGCYFWSFAAENPTGNCFAGGCFAVAPVLRPPGVVAAWRCRYLPGVVTVARER